MLSAFIGFLLGVVATVCMFRWLDRCWVWERHEEEDKPLRYRLEDVPSDEKDKT